MMSSSNTPGKILLLGSGETSPTGGRVFEMLVKNMTGRPVISILETPAGFELNSKKVAERVGTFLETRLQNYRPVINIIPARKKGTVFSPDDPKFLQPLFTSSILYMGAGSPTYAVRQLEDSLAWEMLLARHARGAAVVLASAAIIAAGVKALPIYEIFKVGQDPFWGKGLDMLGVYGLELVFVPHWNNQEGGVDLDTSRCFMGRERFDPLQAQLPAGMKVVGVDELTALMIDFQKTTCEVIGQGSLHILTEDKEEIFQAGENFPLSKLGDYEPMEGRLPGVSEEVWNEVLETEISGLEETPNEIPAEILRLADERQSARLDKNWQLADSLRLEIEKAGWQVNDTSAGPKIESLNSD